MAIFRPDEEARVRELLGEMERNVELVLVLGREEEALPGAREIDFSGQAQALLQELVALSERLTARTVAAPAYGADRFPAICVLPEGQDVGVRYYGLPWGYELSSLVGACREAGRTTPSLTADSLAALGTIERDVSLEVFVTPT